MSKEAWINQCNEWKNKWPTYLPEHSDDTDGLNIYEVLETINENLTDNHIVMADAGSPSYACPTNLKAAAPGQFIFNPSQADMGWAVPASVGVALNAPNKITVVVVGDGSFYSNVQELAVIAHHKLPVKLIVLNNNGYLSIKNTQTKYFDGRVYGVDNTSGLFFADLQKIADTFNFSYLKIPNRSALKSNANTIMNTTYHQIIEVMCKENQEILPAQAFKTLPDGTKIQAPLHDMLPFLSDDELAAELKK
jgi:acetolactate synthase-1/2/3 large subunit